jgi:hypothetical protein
MCAELVVIFEKENNNPGFGFNPLNLFLTSYVLQKIFNFVQSIVNNANKISNIKATKKPPIGEDILSIGPCK